MLQKKGHKFESKTNAEVVTVLLKYIWDFQGGKLNFTTLVKIILKELKGFVFKSLMKSLLHNMDHLFLLESRWKRNSKVVFVDVEITGPDVKKGAGLCKLPHFTLSRDCPDHILQCSLVSFS